MSQTYDQIFLVAVNTKLDNSIGTRFSLDEIADEIIANGGIPRVAGVLLKDYLQNICALGILDILSGDKIRYEVVSEDK